MYSVRQFLPRCSRLQRAPVWRGKVGKETFQKDAGEVMQAQLARLEPPFEQKRIIDLLPDDAHAKYMSAIAAGSAT